jgi:hypothetical protein
LGAEELDPKGLCLCDTELFKALIDLGEGAALSEAAEPTIAVELGVKRLTFCSSTEAWLRGGRLVEALKTEEREVISTALKANAEQLITIALNGIKTDRKQLRLDLRIRAGLLHTAIKLITGGDRVVPARAI